MRGTDHGGGAERALQVRVTRSGLGRLHPAGGLVATGRCPCQDARCLADGKRVMSAPVSATMMSAVRVMIPGIVQIKSWNPRKGCITTSIRSVSCSIAVVC